MRVQEENLGSALREARYTKGLHNFIIDIQYSTICEAKTASRDLQCTNLLIHPR
jgi:hypothetical protein